MRMGEGNEPWRNRTSNLLIKRGTEGIKPEVHLFNEIGLKAKLDVHLSQF